MSERTLRDGIEQHGPAIRRALLFFDRYATRRDKRGGVKEALTFIEYEAKLAHISLAADARAKRGRR